MGQRSISITDPSFPLFEEARLKVRIDICAYIKPHEQGRKTITTHIIQSPYLWPNFHFPKSSSVRDFQSLYIFYCWSIFVKFLSLKPELCGFDRKKASGIEESDEFSYDFDKFPTYDEVLEAWCRGTDYETPRSRDDVSFYFFASSTDNDSLNCDYEW